MIVDRGARMRRRGVLNPHDPADAVIDQEALIQPFIDRMAIDAVGPGIGRQRQPGEGLGGGASHPTTCSTASAHAKLIEKKDVTRVDGECCAPTTRSTAKIFTRCAPALLTAL